MGGTTVEAETLSKKGMRKALRSAPTRNHLGHLPESPGTSVTTIIQVRRLYFLLVLSVWVSLTPLIGVGHTPGVNVGLGVVLIDVIHRPASSVGRASDFYSWKKLFCTTWGGANINHDTIIS